METQLETLRGVVDTITYANSDNGFCVFELDAQGELVTVVGEVLGLAEGEEVILNGRYTSHPTYGQQFKAEAVQRSLPATSGAILKYLSSGAIKGIGPKIARKIVEEFGDKTLEVIEKNPMLLSELAGISKKKALDISEQYRQIFGLRSVMLFLSEYQIDPAAAIRVWRQWGNHAIEVVKENPYMLCCEQVGVDFIHADAIAMNMGMGTSFPGRLKAGIAYVLTHNLSNGHTCLPKDKLLTAASGMLEVEKDFLEDALFEGIEDGDFVLDKSSGEYYVYLTELYEAETHIAGRIALMLKINPPDNRSFDAKIKSLEHSLDISYDPLQRKAIETALKNNVFILTGGPGTGKTTTLNAILRLLKEDEKNVSLAAPTGRAAKRMSEVTGSDATTIHRLLEVDFRKDGEGLKFKRNEKNPIKADVIILDEVSMVDTKLLHSLMKAMRMNTSLILVGDPNQLPSVGAGNILKDLIQSDMIPMVHLNEIFRQARESLIVSNAHQIVKGETPDLSIKTNDFFFLPRQSYENTMQTVAELCAKRLPKAYGLSPLADIQVIAPSRVGALGTVELNIMLQKKLNPPAPNKVEQKFGNIIFREKDKVMHIKNNYDIIWHKEDGEEGTGVFNGDIGIIEMIDRPSQTVFVRYDDRVAQYAFDNIKELEHAYAITVHKSQGSEFEAVIMPLMSYHNKLYYRNILYTAVTRARKIMIILGQQDTVFKTVANDRKVLRYTNLAPFLIESVMGKNLETEIADE